MPTKYPEATEDARHMLRFADMVEEPRKMLMPIKGHENVPLVSLEEAIEPLVPLVDDVRRMAWTAKQKCEEPTDGLSCDESASIMLYSMEWKPHERCLYVVLNAALRAPNRRGLTPWFLFLRLILTGLSRLPSIRVTIYRGIKLDLSTYYKQNKKFVWWGFSSCTRNVGVLSNEQFLGKTGDRTIFNITSYSGKNIRNHSYFETEDEVLLLPARQFTVASILNPAEGLHIIQIDEVEPEFPLLEPLPSITYYPVPSANVSAVNEYIVKSNNTASPQYTYSDFDYKKCHAQDAKVKCRYGGECGTIDDRIHSQKYDHPSYCSQGGFCQNMDANHLKQFRHLPLCKDASRCIAYLKADQEHCKRYRHCQPSCPYGNNCISFHNKDHLKDFKHPFIAPCPLTPFVCPLYTELSEATVADIVKKNVEQHCLDYSHVCRFGRNCKINEPLHQRNTIHIIRHLCPYDDKCKKLYQEEHLNSYSHTKLADIRRLCQYGSKCYDLHKLDHITKWRHARTDEEIGVVHLYHLNFGLNFVQNQCENIRLIQNYVKKQGWKPLPSDGIPRQILDYFRTVQPVHRCSPFIFESILLHGHVMSRDYMERLKNIKFVATSVMQHSRVRRIYSMNIPQYNRAALNYITEVVRQEFATANFPPLHHATKSGMGALATADSHQLPLLSDSMDEFDQTAKSMLTVAKQVFTKGDLEVMKSKAIEVAQASIKLHSNPAGIDYAPNKVLGMHKRVFSILGPHLGHYYGDVFIAFKREILHHPDADFSMCAATTFGGNGNAYRWRPWLTDPTTAEARIKHYHQTKLHASTPGFEYAIALESMAITSLHFKLKSLDIDLAKLFERWMQVDSHQNIEGHLPQLIPIDYIDHIYVAQNIYDTFTAQTRQSLNAVFKNRYTIMKQNGLATGNPLGQIGPIPSNKDRAEYQKAVTDELMQQYKHNITYGASRPVQGSAITIAGTNFNECFTLPLTISQAYELYRFQKEHNPTENIAYIYWQAIDGDMMLVLSKKSMNDDEPSGEDCLLCYISPKYKSHNNNYHEQATYISVGQPIQHHKFIKKQRFKASSNRFHIGSNTDDYITYCLEIHRSEGKVILRQAGSNAIYNHEQISSVLSKKEINLSELEYISITSDTKEVSVRNLFVTFEKQTDLECTADLNFKNPN